MKKIILILLIFISYNTIACDACACGAGGSFLGILPNSNKNLIGYKFQNQNFNFIPSNVNINGQSEILSDHYYRNDIWFRYYFNPKIQVIGILPYQIHQRKESLRNTTINGIGDFSLLALYNIYNTGDSSDFKIKQTWRVGGLLVVPTGKYQQRDETLAMLPILFQIGKGAYSYGLQNMYTLKINNWGINTDYRYIWNSENEIGQKLGNQFIGVQQLFYSYKTPVYSFVPAIGYMFDFREKNTDNKIADIYTGGSAQVLLASLDFYYSKWMVQTMIYKPLQVNLAEAMPQNDFAFSIGVAYFLNSNKH